MNKTQTTQTNEKNVCSAVNWITTEQDLLFDLKCLIKEYYVATFTDSGKTLKLSFENGQSFIISVKSCN